MNGENATNMPKPISPAADKDGISNQATPYASFPSEQTIPQQRMNQTEIFQPMQQTGFYQPYSPQAGMLQPAMQPTSIFHPPQMQQMMPQNGMQPRTSIMASGRGVRDSVLSDVNFTQGFLQTQIGRHVKVEFLIGTNMFVDREGDLIRVGTDYIIIQETETDDYLLCDIYSIKFIRFYY